MPSLSEAAELMLRGVEEQRARAMRGEGGQAIEPADPYQWTERDRDIRRYEEQYERMRQMAQYMPQVYADWNQTDYDPIAQTARPARQRPPAKEPTATRIEPAETVDAEYAALVAELGVSSIAVDLERFKGWLHASGLQVYKRDEVQEYLHAKYKVPVGNVSTAVLWGWRPLRDADRTKKDASPKNGEIQRGTTPYAKPIPMPVLRTVKAVRDLVPGAKFFVSDEMQAERIPDPFLLVEIGTEQFVIERWDEPSFRSK